GASGGSASQSWDFSSDKPQSWKSRWSIAAGRPRAFRIALTNSTVGLPNTSCPSMGTPCRYSNEPNGPSAHGYSNVPGGCGPGLLSITIFHVPCGASSSHGPSNRYACFNGNLTLPS